MGLINLIAGSAIRTVTLDGLEFQIRRVRSADLAMAGNAQLLAMVSAQDITPVQLTKLRQAQEAMVVAGVVAIRQTGSEEWQPIEVSSSKPSDDAAGSLNVGDLPDGYRKRLSEEIMAHSVDQGGLQQSLDTFRS